MINTKVYASEICELVSSVLKDKDIDVTDDQYDTLHTKITLQLNQMILDAMEEQIYAYRSLPLPKKEVK